MALSLVLGMAMLGSSACAAMKPSGKNCDCPKFSQELEQTAPGFAPQTKGTLNPSMDPFQVRTDDQTDPI
jgi:hypothetical protein